MYSGRKESDSSDSPGSAQMPLRAKSVPHWVLFVNNLGTKTLEFQEKIVSVNKILGEEVHSTSRGGTSKTHGKWRI